MCEEYLTNFHKNDIVKILNDEDTTKHFSININFLVLYEHQSTIVLKLLKAPEQCLEEWDIATLKAQLTLLKEAGNGAQLKNNVHCRIYNLPVLSVLRRTIFPTNDDAGKFLQISGTVMRMSASKLLEYQRNYLCIKCKYSMLVKAEYDKKYIIKQPKKCENPEECSGTNLVAFGELDSDNCKDYQEIKVQERVKKLGVGCMPNTMWVTLEDDLVDSCKPGDNITICGIVVRRWGEFSKGSKIDIDIVLKANNVQVDNNSCSTAATTPDIKQMFDTFWEKHSGNPLAGRDLILRSFCPQIYGLYLVKLAIAVVLAGGSRIEDTTSTGVRTRSESHLLLVGDPGTGKSELLRFASKIIQRSVLTTGVGSTAAGLTVTALMEHGEWQLEGGALVMSDGGICCIDEFNSMKEHDRTSIHEAMEQQTISVAKAGIVCKLNTRCSILAACNPKGNLNMAEPLCMNIALPSPLLSRFDLILLLRDTVNEDWDTQVVDYILNGGNKFSKLTDSALWNVDILQFYFTLIRKLNPKLSENAEKILSSYYQMQRRIDSRNKARTTVRLLESLVRLSQGHARLMYHKEVETMDSIYAIILVDAAMENDSSILDLNISTYSVFPQWPSQDYRNMLQAVLNKLGLHEMLDKELASLNAIRNSELAENVRSRFFQMQHKISDDEGLDECNNVNADKVGKYTKNKGNKRVRSPEGVDEAVKKTCETTNGAAKANFHERDATTSSSSNVPMNNANNESIAKLTGTEGKKTDEATSINDKYVCESGGGRKISSKKCKEVVKTVKEVLNFGNDISELDFDEGYDTLAFVVPDTKKCANKDTASDQSRNRSLNINKSNVEPESLEEAGASSILSNLAANNQSIGDKGKESGPVISSDEIVGVKQKSIKNKLNRFKFVLKDNPSESTGDLKVNNVDEDGELKKKLPENNYNDFIREDLAMLKLIPSASDDFNIDLDFDWDNMESAGIQSKTKKKKIEKKLSDATIASRNSSSSSQSSKKNIFYATDENIDDWDLDI